MFISSASFKIEYLEELMKVYSLTDSTRILYLCLLQQQQQQQQQQPLRHNFTA